jgi:hypothetical protein
MNFSILLLLLIPIFIHFFNFRKSTTVFFSNSSTLDRILIKDGYKSRLNYLTIFMLRFLSLTTLFLFLYFAVSGWNLKSNLEVSNKLLFKPSIPLSEVFKSPKIRSSSDLIYKIDESIFQLNGKSIVFQETLSEFLNNVKSSNVEMVSNDNENVIIIASKHDLPYLASLDPNTNFILSDFNKDIINVAVDTIFFSNKGTEESKMLRICFISNFKTDREFSYRVIIDNIQVGNGIVSFENNINVCIDISSLNLNKSKFGKIEIDNDDILFDNDFYFILNSTQQKELLLIEVGCSSAFPPIFFNQNLFNVNTVNLDDVSKIDLSSYEAIIINGIEGFNLPDLKDFEFLMSSGIQKVIAIPCKDYLSLNQSFLTKYINDKIEKEPIELPDNSSYLFQGVFSQTDQILESPIAKSKLDLSIGYKPILKTKGSRVVFGQSINYSNFFVFSFPFSRDYSDFHESNLVLPLFYKLLLDERVDLGTVDYLRLGEDQYNNSIMRSNSKEILTLGINELILVPDQRWIEGDFVFKLEENFVSIGHVTLLSANKEEVGFTAFNYPNYNRLGYFDSLDLKDFESFSNISILNYDDLNRFYNQISAKDSFSVWKYCLILAMFFIILEIFVLRRLK